MLHLSETFFSIQGEGMLTGVPSAFIRFTGCNLKCVWCDTPYTSWKPEGQRYSIDEVVAEVAAWGSRHTVVTGGEPMIHHEVASLCTQLRAIGQHITIETNGTVFRELACDLMSISPKLRNSTPFQREGGKFAIQHEELRWRAETVRQLMAAYPYQFKFVVADRSDMEEVQSMVQQVQADPKRVMLMPEGNRPKTIRDRTWLLEACQFFGYRYAQRLHVQLWGDRRGV